MNKPYTIRQATAEDIPLAVQFRWLLFGPDGKETAIPHIRQTVTRLYTEAYRNDRITHFFAYSEDGQPIACAGAILKDDFPYCLFTPGYYGWIIDVYTDPAYRGNGIATALLKVTHAWLQQKGAYESKLIAVGDKPQALYARLGYRKTWEMSFNLNPAQETYNEMIDRTNS